MTISGPSVNRVEWGRKLETAPNRQGASLYAYMEFCRKCAWRLFFPLRRYWLRAWAFVDAIATEFHILIPRIRRICKTKPYRVGIHIGPSAVRLSTGRDVSCNATFSRMQDIQDMRANHPWATPLDVEVFLEGWDMGARWAACSDCSPEHRITDLEGTASANVIQQLEALQESKRDLLSRSPWRA